MSTKIDVVLQYREPLDLDIGTLGALDGYWDVQKILGSGGFGTAVLVRATEMAMDDRDIREFLERPNTVPDPNDPSKRIKQIRNPDDPRLAVLKILMTEDDDSLKRFKLEKELGSTLAVKHPNYAEVLGLYHTRIKVPLRDPEALLNEGHGLPENRATHLGDQVKQESQSLEERVASTETAPIISESYHAKVVRGDQMLFNWEFPTERVPEVQNMLKKILGSPIELTAEGLEGNIEVRLPFVADPSIDINSIAVYYYANGWRLLESKQDYTAETISAQIPDVGSIAQNNKILLATIGDYRLQDVVISYLVMEYIPGEEPLEGSFREWRIRIDDVVNYAIQGTKALDELHERAKSHQDIKPENIIVDPHGNLVIIDLGIMKDRQNKRSLTVNNAGPMGTPPYMPPDQWESERGESNDWYAFSATMYEFVGSQKRKDGTIFKMQLYTEPGVERAQYDLGMCTAMKEPSPLGQHRNEIHPIIPMIIHTGLAKISSQRTNFKHQRWRWERVKRKEQYYHPQVDRSPCYADPDKILGRWEQAKKRGLAYLTNADNFIRNPTGEEYFSRWFDLLDLAPLDLKREGTSIEDEMNVEWRFKDPKERWGELVKDPEWQERKEKELEEIIKSIETIIPQIEIYEGRIEEIREEIRPGDDGFAGPKEEGQISKEEEIEKIRDSIRINEDLKRRKEGEIEKIRDSIELRDQDAIDARDEWRRLRDKEIEAIRDSIELRDTCMEHLVEYLTWYGKRAVSTPQQTSALDKVAKLEEWFIEYSQLLRHEQAYLVRYAKNEFGIDLEGGSVRSFKGMLGIRLLGEGEMRLSVETERTRPPPKEIQHIGHDVDLSGVSDREESDSGAPFPTPEGLEELEGIVSTAMDKYDGAEKRTLRTAKRARRSIIGIKGTAEQLKTTSPNIYGEYTELLREADEHVESLESLQIINSQLDEARRLLSKYETNPSQEHYTTVFYCIAMLKEHAERAKKYSVAAVSNVAALETIFNANPATQTFVRNGAANGGDQPEDSVEETPTLELPGVETDSGDLDEILDYAPDGSLDTTAADVELEGYATTSAPDVGSHFEELFAKGDYLEAGKLQDQMSGEMAVEYAPKLGICRAAEEIYRDGEALKNYIVSVCKVGSTGELDQDIMQTFVELGGDPKELRRLRDKTESAQRLSVVQASEPANTGEFEQAFSGLKSYVTSDQYVEEAREAIEEKKAKMQGLLDELE